MNKNTKIIVAILVAGALGWLAFGFFGIQSLFINQEVNEDIPESVSKLIADGSGAGQELVGQGSFQQGDSTYTISGNAYLSRIEGKLNLTFTDFDVTNGPNLYVYAVKADSTENATVKEAVAKEDFISLGTLKGNIGNQNYVLEKDFDPEEYQVISIWCQRFSRNFGTVKLAAEAAE
ncbi:MAG: DM13 domain-containing protein [Akkermansiaceae bacterium]